MPNNAKTNYRSVAEIEPEGRVIEFLVLMSAPLEYAEKRWVLYHEGLLDVANRFCQNCGTCCDYDCLAAYKEGGKTYCRLHHNDPANGREEDYPIDSIDLTKAKPLKCHNTGPGHYYSMVMDMREIGRECGLEKTPCVQLIDETMERFKKEIKTAWESFEKSLKEWTLHGTPVQKFDESG